MQRSTNYKLLFSGILAFYVIMTYDHQALTDANPLAIIKLAIGIPAILYILWYSLVHGRRSKEERPEE